MSRAKLFNLVKSRGENSIGRNTFDLTNRHAYTSKAGKITPVKCIHTYPDDYFEVSVSEFSQNNIPMNTAAFLSGKKELLAYFVPYNTIWHNFNQYQATREDPESTILKEKGISYEPRIRMFTLYDNALYFAIGQWIFKNYVDIMTLRTLFNMDERVVAITDGMTAAEYIELCKSVPMPNHEDFDVWSWYHNSCYWTLRNDAAYLYSAFFDASDDATFPLGVSFYCREYSREHKEDLTLFDTYTNMFGNFIWCDWCQKMDMLGYGNIYPILKPFLDEMGKLTDDICTTSTYDSDSGHLYYKENGSQLNWAIDSNEFDLSVTPKLKLFTDIAKKYRDLLGSLVSYTDREGERQPEYLNVYAIYAYNKCFYDFMRNVYFDTDYSVYNYNCDFIDGNSLEGSTIIGADIPLRWYHLECHQWKKDMFTGVLPSNQLGQVSELILNAGSSGTISQTLPVDLSLSGSVGTSVNSVVSGNISSALANSSITGGVTGSIGTPTNYSGASAIKRPDGSSPGIGDNTQLRATSADLMNALAYGDVRAETSHAHDITLSHNLGFSADIVNSNGINVSSSLNNGSVNFNGSRASIDIPSITGAGAAVLNVLALKRAEAIQQYRQDLMRAGNRTQDVFQQVYGTTPKSQLDEAPYFIEVQSNDINVNPIISTAQTGQELNGKLGDIAARCTISGSSLDFKFSTKDFGVIIFLSYVVPEAFYNSYRIDPLVTHLDQEAHGLPYFQNLGLQPVIGSSLSNMQDADARNSSRGFAPPYLERKTDIDLCHGNLCDLFFEEDGVLDVNYQGSLSHWVVARTDMQSEKTLSLRNFYINPRILDNVFTFNAQDDYETDHFLNYCSIKVNAVRAFSELGLPRF